MPTAELLAFIRDLGTLDTEQQTALQEVMDGT